MPAQISSALAFYTSEIEAQRLFTTL